MPGYGIKGPEEGSGLLPWAWAEERLTNSHDYWITTVRPDDRPHVMPVWGMWHEFALWFSSSVESRKTRNLLTNPHCSVATDDANEAVVMEGRAEIVTDLATLEVVLDLENRKYSTAYTMEMLDPATNACFRVQPARVFAIATADFTGSPTRWVFEQRL